MFELPKSVLSRDGSEHRQPTGSHYRCQQEGCTGRRIPVRWPDGKVTRPCSKALKVLDDTTWQIE